MGVLSNWLAARLRNRSVLGAFAAILLVAVVTPGIYQWLLQLSGERIATASRDGPPRLAGAPTQSPVEPAASAEVRRQGEERARPRATTEAASVTLRPAAVPVPAARKEQIEQFVAGYDGGDCFFIDLITVAEGKAIIEGYGSSVAPFEMFDYDWRRQIGFEASIGVRQVTPTQCAAVRFLSRVRTRADLVPRVDITATVVKNSSALTGTVANFGNSNVDLLLVADDGSVHSLTGMLKPAGQDKTFTIYMQRTSPGAAQPQLLIAVAGSKPLEALRPVQLGTAEHVFTQALAEALQTGQSLRVVAKYFKLE